MGWALFKRCDGRLVEAGVVLPNRRLEWGARTDVVLQTLADICGRFEWENIKLMACEWPMYFDDAGGNMVAKRGDLVKLVFVVGRIAQLAFECGVDFMPVPVRTWKGQLPKYAVESRICRRLMDRKDEYEIVHKAGTHAWDAVGIGMHVLGTF